MSATMPVEAPNPGVNRDGVDPEHDAIRTRNAERQVKHAQRKLQCIELRRAGFTFDEIGQRLKISQQHASKLFRAAILDTYRRPSEEERDLELLRVDGVIKRWWPSLLNPDDEIAERASKQLRWAFNYRADLLGLKRAEIDIHIDGSIDGPPTTGNELWSILEEFRQAALRGERDPAEPPSMAELQPAAQSNGSEPIEVIAHTNGHKPPGDTP